MKPRPTAVAAWIGADGRGHAGVVVKATPGQTTKSKATISQRKSARGVLVELRFDALDNRTVVRRVVANRRLTRAEGQALCERIARAQTRAMDLRMQRSSQDTKAMPQGFKLKVLREVFPKTTPGEPEWLANVARACGASYANDRLKSMIDAGDLASVEKFIHLWRDEKHRAPSKKAAIDLFIFASWNELVKPGMTAEKAHDLASQALGHDTAGTLDSFQRYVRRHGIRFAPAHRPK